MAQQDYRVNLSASLFPMVPGRIGQPVIVPGPDNNYDRRVDPTGETSPAGIPQAIYLENVLPTVEGYQSAGWQDVGTWPVGVTPLPAWDYFEMKGMDLDHSRLLSFTSGSGASKKVYEWIPEAKQWLEVAHTGNATAWPDINQFSYAIVGNDIYLTTQAEFFKYTYGGAGGLQENSASYLPGGVLTDVKCMTSSFNYLILVKQAASGLVQVLWSSLLSPVDFTPSLVTGAGGGTIANAEGHVVGVRAAPGGFYIYCTENVIFAQYTGNVRYPFKFVTVQDAVGVVRNRDIFGDVTDSFQVACTKAKTVQLIQGIQAQNVAQEVSEYIERATSVPSFDYASGTLSLTQAPLGWRTCTPYIFGNKYLCISLSQDAPDAGTVLYTEVLVLDNSIKRWGRLKFDHYKLFSSALCYDTAGIGSPSFTEKLLLAGITPTTPNNVRHVFWNVPNADQTHKGVLLLGRYKYVRARDLCIDEVQVDLEPQNPADTVATVQGLFSLSLYSSRNGTDFSAPVAPYLDLSQSSIQSFQYLCLVEGKSVMLGLKGRFTVPSITMRFHPGGS